MGYQYATRAEELTAEREAIRIREEYDANLAAVAAKIAMVTIDTIVRIVIRPGPVAEERECYEMAQEVRDNDERLTNLILDVLNVSVGEKLIHKGRKL